MAALTATVAAASVVLPLVVQGEQLGKLHDAGCTPKPVRSGLASLREAGRAPTRTEPIVIDTGELLAPDPNTRYAVVQGGSMLTSLASTLRGRGARPVFDVMVPGRYDLAIRRDRLRALTDEVDLPWVVANLTPAFKTVPYKIIERDGVRIGVTAVIDDRLGSSLHPRVRTEKLVEARKALGDTVRQLREQGVDLVLAVSHQSSKTPLKSILRLVDGTVERPDVLIMSPLAGDVVQVSLGERSPIVLAAPSGARRALLAFVEVRRGAGDPRFLGARRITLEARPDAELSEVRREVCAALGTEMGPTEKRRKTISEDEFATFVLELMRRRTGAEVAVINRATIRDTFPISAPITPLALMRILPFDDGIQTADLRGSEIRSLLRLAGDGRVRVSGISAGKVAGRAIDSARTYRVAAVDFVAAGGDDVFKAGELDWTAVDGVGELRQEVADYLRTYGFDPDADPDPDDEPEEPALLSAQLNLGGNLKTVTVSNAGDYEAPQLSRNQFLGITALLDLRVIADFTNHRFQLFERTRYGIAREGTGDAEENDDVTTVELTYIGRFASEKEPWYIPNASAAISLETELTVPEAGDAERDYRRALLQAGIGPSFPLLPNMSFRVQLGVRRELLASEDSEDEQERLLAQTRMAMLSTLEILKYSFPTDYGRPLTTTLRVDHAFDLTGTVRDNILQGRLDFDVPVARRLSLTVGLELYFQDRAVDDGSPDPGSGLAFDTSFGVKTFGDLSTALF